MEHHIEIERERDHLRDLAAADDTVLNKTFKLVYDNIQWRLINTYFHKLLALHYNIYIKQFLNRSYPVRY
jgi:hypothetical protein